MLPLQLITHNVQRILIKWARTIAKELPRHRISTAISSRSILTMTIRQHADSKLSCFKTISKIHCWTAFDLGSNVLGHHEVEN